MQSNWKAAIEKYTKAIRYLAPESFDPEDEAEPDQAKQMADATCPALLNRQAPQAFLASLPCMLHQVRHCCKCSVFTAEIRSGHQCLAGVVLGMIPRQSCLQPCIVS